MGKRKKQKSPNFVLPYRALRPRFWLVACGFNNIEFVACGIHIMRFVACGIRYDVIRSIGLKYDLFNS